jgi:hypothetical protein
LGKQGGDANPRERCRPDLFDVQVLVVDDSATNRQILTRQAVAFGMQSAARVGARKR